jgi:hypothetical protein
MNDTLTYQPEPFERPDKPAKKGCGCGSFIIAFLVFVVAIIASIWIIIMHTSVPLRFVADLIEDSSKSSNLKLTGLSGSLYSGLSLKKVTWNDGEITDMRFRYSGLMDVINRDELIIHEMHIGSATIHYDSTADKTQVDPSTSSSGSSTTSTGSSSEPPLKLFQIDRVSLNKIIIKDRATGKTIDIPKIQWTEFKAEKGADIQFGDLVANSDHLVIKTSNPPGSVYQKRFEITLLPKLDDRILNPIKIDAYLGENGKQAIYEIKAFDDTVTLTTDKSGVQQIKTKDANLADFFDAPLPNKLNFESSETISTTEETTITINSGSFLLGTKAFEIQPLSFTKDTSTNPNLIAIHRAGETEIRYEALMNQKDFKAKLTSTPAMSPENLLAFIYHEREFSTLSKPDQERLRKYMTWFTFTK